MLIAMNGSAAAQPSPNSPVANPLATAHATSEAFHWRRGRVIRSAISNAEANHRNATPPPKRVSPTASEAAAK